MLAGQMMNLIPEFCAYFCNTVCKRKKMSLKMPKVICELEYVVLKWNVLWQTLSQIHKMWLSQAGIRSLFFFI